MIKSESTRSEKTNQFFTTRPKLASYLFQNGFYGERTVNAYDTARPAWIFEKSDALEKCVAQYYKTERK